MSSEGERPEGGSGGRDNSGGDGPEENQSTIHIGNISGGTFAIGSHASASAQVGPSTENSTVELLSALRELRADLRRVRRTDSLMFLDEALAAAEDEIVRTEEISIARLDRLRMALADAEMLVELFASAAAVAGLLGVSSSRARSARPRPTTSKPGSRDAPAGHTPPGPSPGSDDDEWPEIDG